MIKGQLKELAGTLAARAGGDVKVFVDTAPVMEKPLAEAAGLGWQGKHTNLVSREHRLLAVPRRDLHHRRARRRRARGGPLRLLPRLPRRLPDRRLPGALPARCAALHLLPDHREQGPDPAPSSAQAIGNRIYGCDDCLAVCPWNKFAQRRSRGEARRRATICARRALADLLALDDAAFRALFSGSPVKRIGRDRFVRNVLIAAGNSRRRRRLCRACRALLADASPLVRGAAVWALSRLLEPSGLRHAGADRAPGETDADVLDRMGRWRRPADRSARPDGSELDDRSFFIFGAGYSGKAFAARSADAAVRIAGTTRSPEKFAALRGSRHRALRLRRRRVIGRDRGGARRNRRT